MLQVGQCNKDGGQPSREVDFYIENKSSAILSGWLWAIWDGNTCHQV